MHTHTHAHTHTPCMCTQSHYTHACRCTHMHTGVCMHTHTCTPHKCTHSHDTCAHACMYMHPPQVHFFCSICWVHYFKSTSYPYVGLSCLFLMWFRFTKLIINTSCFTSFTGSSETFLRPVAPTQWPRRHVEGLSVHRLLAPPFWESEFVTECWHRGPRDHALRTQLCVNGSISTLSVLLFAEYIFLQLKNFCCCY